MEIRGYKPPEQYMNIPIAIYASRTAPTKQELKEINDNLGRRLPTVTETITANERGVIVAIAQITWYKQVDESMFKVNVSEHLAAPEYYKEGKTYFWKLTDVKPLDTPIPFKFNGTMVWSAIESEMLGL